jgi:hypothetical protein
MWVKLSNNMVASMFQHIIGNPKLVKNPQNTWKHHKTRLAETDTKLAALVPKLLIGQIRVDRVPLVHVLNALRLPLDTPKDPKVQPWLKLVQPIHSMLLSMPSLWTLW